MEYAFSRTELLYGREAREKLVAARVAIFGLGGVGGYVLEALARSGVGQLDLIDHDRISLSNLNRQILATRRTLGQYKVDAAAERVASINPDCRVRGSKIFFLPETCGQFDFHDYDYVVDAIDTVTGKLTLIERAQAAGHPSSAPWALATSWTRAPSGWRICMRRRTAPWPASCGGSAAGAGSRP